MLEELDLPGLAESLVEAIPEDTVDSLAPTGPILRRASRGLDVQELLGELGSSQRVEDALSDAVVQAAQDEIRERLLDRLPSGLEGVVGRIMWLHGGTASGSCLVVAMRNRLVLDPPEVQVLSSPADGGVQASGLRLTSRTAVAQHTLIKFRS